MTRDHVELKTERLVGRVLRYIFVFFVVHAHMFIQILIVLVRRCHDILFAYNSKVVTILYSDRIVEIW